MLASRLLMPNRRHNRETLDTGPRRARSPTKMLIEELYDRYREELVGAWLDADSRGQLGAVRHVHLANQVDGLGPSRQIIYGVRVPILHQEGRRRQQRG